jgi:LCP family protein required for cell wall assembly
MLVATNVLVAVTLLAAGSVYGYVTWRFGQIKRISIPSIGGHPAEPPGSPMTILVVGSDSRAGITGPDAKNFGNATQVGGQRSDTIMLLHVDPRSTSATLMSIPRDLWVPIPGKTYSQRINTTFDTGPDLLVQAVQQSLGIPVDHYVEVNFNSFRQIVNAVGGVKQYFPTPARDVYSNLVIPAAGCYALTGDQALQYVRSRHYEYYANGRWHFEAESDLARIRRQQEFIKKMMGKAQSTGLTNPLRLNSIVSAIANNLTVDKGFSLSTMLSLAKRFRSLSPAALPSVTVPTNPAVIQGNDVLVLKQPDASQAVAQFLGQSPAAAPTASSLPAPPPGLSAAQVRVAVVNGTGQPGQAAQVQAALRAQGFVVTSIATGTSLGNPTTVVRYGPSAAGKAALVAASVVGGAQLQASDAATGADVTIVTGASYGGIRAPGSAAAATGTPTPAAPATSAPSTTVPATPPTTAYALPGTPPGLVPPPC